MPAASAVPQKLLTKQEKAKVAALKAAEVADAPAKKAQVAVAKADAAQEVCALSTTHPLRARMSVYSFTDGTDGWHTCTGPQSTSSGFLVRLRTPCGLLTTENGVAAPAMLGDNKCWSVILILHVNRVPPRLPFVWVTLV